MPNPFLPHRRMLAACVALFASFAAAPLPAAEATLAVLSVEPREVAGDGSTLVAVRGTAFGASTHIRIAGRPLRHARLGVDGLITGFAPPLNAGEPLGPRDVVARSGREQARLADGVVYVKAAAVSLQDTALALLRRRSTEAVRVAFAQGVPRTLSARVAVPGATSLDRARAFVAEFKDLYAQDSSNLSLVPARLAHEGEDDVLFAQTFRGLPVFGAGLYVTLEQGAVVSAVASLLTSRAVPSLAPVLDARQAEERAWAALGRVRGSARGETRLVIYDPALFRNVPSRPRPVWRVTLSAGERVRVLVDAATGEIALVFGADPSSGPPLHDFDFDLQDAEGEANAVDDHCFDWSDDVDIGDEDGVDPDYQGVLSAVKADEFARRVYGFYNHDLDWHSYDDDGTGSQLEMFLNSDMDPARLAGWSVDCELMAFAPHAVADDVVGHEFTHGVVSYGSGLVYLFESGALNESYADVMGVVEDQQHAEANGLFVDWLMGEGVGSLVSDPFRTGPIRSLADPSKSLPNSCTNCTTQPDHMTIGPGFDDLCTPVGSFEFCQDNGGVHRNSGIFNKAKFLMAAGGTHPGSGITVDGMGRTRMRDLSFWALTHIPYFSNFDIASFLEIDRAEKWAQSGAHGFTPEDACTVRNAYAAVGLGAGVTDTDCDGVPDILDDTDKDGVENAQDNCPYDANASQANNDFDAAGDACDPDDDQDGFPDTSDGCPTIFGYDEDAPCDDLDDDGVLDRGDNCPFDYNPGQVDGDHDGEGDACEVDPDGDGVDAQADNCSLTPNPGQENQDGDAYGDACDKCPLIADPNNAYGFNGQPFQPDSDDDGTPDACDLDALLNSAPFVKGLLRPDGTAREVEVEGQPRSTRRLPLVVCPEGDCVEALPPGYRVQVQLSGLDPDVRAWIVDDAGNAAAKHPSDQRGDRFLSFRPQGGRDYFLYLVFGPRFDGTRSARFAAALTAETVAREVDIGPR